jgi:hypothetical protein
MFSGSLSRKRDTDERSSVSSSSKLGHDKKKTRSEVSITPRVTPPQRPASQQASTPSPKERVLTPVSQEQEDSDPGSDSSSSSDSEQEPEPPKEPEPPREPSPEPEPEPVPDPESEPADDDDMAPAKGNTPDVFRGPQDNLDSFLTQCHLYFFMNDDKFPEEDKKVTYMISYMRGTAYAQFEDRLGAYLADPSGCAIETRRIFASTVTFENELKLVFGSIDKKRTAERELHALQQRTAAKDYAANFQRLSTGLGWNNESLMSQFHKGLKAEVRIAILRKETQPTTLNELIKIAIREDDLIYQESLERKNRAGVKVFHKPNQSKPRHSTNYYGAMPMEIDKLQKKPVKQQKKGKGGKPSTPVQGSCYNCGKPGHFANKCRQPKKKQPNKGEHFADQVTVRKLQVNSQDDIPVVQLAMLSAKKPSQWKFGPNQNTRRNLPAIERTLSREKTVGRSAKHHLHWMIPMSECRDGMCDIWEHREAIDPGQATWWFSKPEKRSISNTQLRRVLEIDDVGYDKLHFHHRHIPDNMCEDESCKLHVHDKFAISKELVTSLNIGLKKNITTGLLSPSASPISMRKTKTWAEEVGLDDDTSTEPEDNDPSWLTTNIFGVEDENKVLVDYSALDAVTVSKDHHPETSGNAERPRKRISWSPKRYLDDTTTPVHHRDLTNEQCELDLCPWHARSPTPAPFTVRGHFTPIDSESDVDETGRDQYVQDLHKAVKKLLHLSAPDWPHKLDMQIPNEQFDVHLKLRADPESVDPAKRFSLHLKAVAKEPESESEVESETEEEDDSSEEETIHGYVSGNEGDSTW